MKDSKPGIEVNYTHDKPKVNEKNNEELFKKQQEEMMQKLKNNQSKNQTNNYQNDTPNSPKSDTRKVDVQKLKDEPGKKA